MYAQIVLYDGFDPLDVIAPYEVLWAGGLATGGALTVELAAADGPGPVTGGSGIVLQATAALDPDRADLVLVPGAAGPVDDIPALLGATVGTRLSELLAEAMKRPDTTVAAVCGGGLVLSMAGLLEGRPAVTHHLGMDLLDATGATAVRARVVDDGDLVTAGGVTSGLDLALHLLDREFGPRVAHAVEELFEYERRGIVWRAGGLEPVAF